MKTTEKLSVGVGASVAIVAVAWWVLQSAPARERAPASVGQMQDAASVRSQLKARYGVESGEEIDAVSARVMHLAFALPWNEDTPSFILDHNQLWADWLRRDRPHLTPETDAIEIILQEPAIDDSGRTIDQVFDTRVGTRTLALGCGSRGVMIMYDPFAVGSLTPASVRFLKHHELGHVSRGDLTCAPDRVREGYTEKDADCWAVGKLRASASGVLAIGAAQEFFFARTDTAVGPYESSQDRSRYLRDGCGIPFD
jgi:hypothetical protein